MSVIDLPQWQALAAHTTPDLRALFAADPARGDQLVAEGAGLMLDYSKQRVSPVAVDAPAETCAGSRGGSAGRPPRSRTRTSRS